MRSRIGPGSGTPRRTAGVVDAGVTGPGRVKSGVPRAGIHQPDVEIPILRDRRLVSRMRCQRGVAAEGRVGDVGQAGALPLVPVVELVAVVGVRTCPALEPAPEQQQAQHGGRHGAEDDRGAAVRGFGVARLAVAAARIRWSGGVRR